jgi:NTE family protein
VLFLLFWFIYSHLSFLRKTPWHRNKAQNRLGLSGGGKGSAHIGVLKVLEEAGVQIDYIGGNHGVLLWVGFTHLGTTPVKLILFFKQLILMSC